MNKTVSLARSAFAALLLAGTVTPPAAAAEPGDLCPALPAPAKPAKKKGLGLGGLFAAAQRAGVTDMIGSGLLGEGHPAQIVGVLGSVAAEAASSASAAGNSAEPSSGCDAAN